MSYFRRFCQCKKKGCWEWVMQNISNWSEQVYPSFWPFSRNLEAKWSLKTYSVSFGGKLLTVVWPLVCVLIALHMEVLSEDCCLQFHWNISSSPLSHVGDTVSLFFLCSINFCAPSLSLSNIACFISMFSHGKSVWCFTRFCVHWQRSKIDRSKRERWRESSWLSGDSNMHFLPSSVDSGSAVDPRSISHHCKQQSKEIPGNGIPRNYFFVFF